ncbi:MULTISPECIES: ABC-three component system protein [Bradyrhizobium]|uniref:ABC-three component systems C-terminal domain-containing protein n=2 Tax=Bradyrhizobium TaxID=374 RepID=A0ABY0PQ79_9BRAD|nr:MULTISPECIES: ABC-three component system protein [Bradyrhizobium]SDI63407.1 hypothetical protein SAMN05444163_3318 [Bradyrhizobium ottawaense]SED34218.1 hypothetical protein SAMN05444171_3850 [Bradyrhizobium lablabi]
MTTKQQAFTAASSAAGYYYQARLALFESLRLAYGDENVDVAIERFDDVSFEKNGQPLELLQTKHHINKVGDLTDISVDLWKTLRVWSEASKATPSMPGRTRLVLITTGQAPPSSAASYLRPNGERDVDKAEALLIAAAQKSANQTLKEAFVAFQKLAPEMRTLLLSSIEILDHAPVLTELEAAIEDRLKLIAPRGKTAIARELLEGWWWPRICKALQEGGGVISILELEAKLDDIREAMKRDALPADMEHFDPPDSELEALNEMLFVRQLRTVGVGNNRIQYAKRDYYRAFTQRSQWTRQNLLFDGEVVRFEKTLVEEWQPRFAVMCDNLNGAASEDATVRQAGQELYHWVEADARFPFRTISAKFLNVGSYHILANDLRLGWHRDYTTLLTKKDEGPDVK